MTVYIYGLYIDTPEGNWIHYVGKTTSPYLRLRSHLSDEGSSRKAKWIQKCLFQEKQVKMEILEQLINPTIEQWQAKEREWIALLNKLGNQLVNSTAGGEAGPTGQKVDPWKGREEFKEYDRTCLTCGFGFDTKQQDIFCSDICGRYYKELNSPEFKARPSYNRPFNTTPDIDKKLEDRFRYESMHITYREQ